MASSGGKGIIAANAADAPRVWAVVSNAKQARIFKRNNRGKLELIDSITSSDHHLHHHPRHINDIQPEDAAFIRRVGDWLHEFAEGDAFDRFVLVASPKALPYFRDAFSLPLQARMMAEVGKDIAHLDDKDVGRELCDIMWF